MVPERWLWDTSRYCKVSIELSWDGIVPLTRLYFNSRKDKLEIFPISNGILPLKLLLLSINICNTEQSPIPVWMGPPSLLLERSNRWRRKSPNYMWYLPIWPKSKFEKRLRKVSLVYFVSSSGMQLCILFPGNCTRSRWHIFQFLEGEFLHSKGKGLMLISYGPVWYCGWLVVV